MILLEKPRRLALAGLRVRDADGEVGPRAPEVARLVRLADAHGNVRMTGDEVGQARDQPLHGEGRQARHLQRRAPGSGLGQPPLYGVEGGRQRGRQPRALLGEAQPVPRPFDQDDAERVLQLLDLAADRAVGDVELLGRRRHAAAPAERLEGAQGVERRQATTGHVKKPHKQAQLNRLAERRNASISVGDERRRKTPRNAFGATAPDPGRPGRGGPDDRRRRLRTP